MRLLAAILWILVLGSLWVGGIYGMLWGSSVIGWIFLLRLTIKGK